MWHLTHLHIRFIQGHIHNQLFTEQGKSEGFDSCDWPSNLTQIGLKSSIFQPVWPKVWWMTLKNNRAHLLYCIKLCASFQSHWWIQTGVIVWKCSNWVQIGVFFPCDLEIWQMTLKNTRAPFPTNLKLCASFHNYWWIQTGVTVCKRPCGSKSMTFLSPVTLKFDGWPWKTIWQLFYDTLSYVHHFVAIYEFKLELWSGKARIGTNLLWPL